MNCENLYFALKMRSSILSVQGMLALSVNECYIIKLMYFEIMYF